MAFDETHSNKASNGDSIHVEFAPQDANDLYGNQAGRVGSHVGRRADRSQSDQSLGYIRECHIAVLDFRQRGGPRQHLSGDRFGCDAELIGPITIAVPSGQTPGSATPTGQVFNSFASEGAFTLNDGSAGHLPVCHRGRDDLGLERGSRYAVDHRGG